MGKTSRTSKRNWTKIIDVSVQLTAYAQDDSLTPEEREFGLEDMIANCDELLQAVRRIRPKGGGKE